MNHPKTILVIDDDVDLQMMNVVALLLLLLLLPLSRAKSMKQNATTKT